MLVHIVTQAVTTTDEQDLDLDIAAALWWVAGMQHGRVESFREVASTWTYATLMTFGFDAEPEPEVVREADHADPLELSGES